jgi:glycosyltransferase involved in cell wall biosynthesis
LAEKTIIVSGINMVEGGIFTILHNCLEKLSQYSRDKELKIIALVYDASQFNFEFSEDITFIEFPKSKKYWLYRLYYEYFYFKKLSKKLQPDVWFSLHDATPNVHCKAQFVYCHNPNIFYKPTIKDWLFEYKVGFFYLFYKFLFRINISKNKAVFVQQHWIKERFLKLFPIKNVFVAIPENISVNETVEIDLDPNFIHFFYPSFARTFKNFELLGDAVQMLPVAIKSKIKIHLTISESDNAYARHIIANYPFSQFNFIGKRSRAEVFGYYKKMDCLLFPSKIETWGLPITEAKGFDKPILLANLPYAKESVGTYKEVSFFDPTNPAELAQLLFEFVSKTIQYQGNKYTFDLKKQYNDWYSLFDFILKE